MADMVIVAYRPKPDCHTTPCLRLCAIMCRDCAASDLRPIVRHWPCVRETAAWWKCLNGAMESAHANPEVLAMWERFATGCDYAPLRDLSETADLFVRFALLDLP